MHVAILTAQTPNAGDAIVGKTEEFQALALKHATNDEKWDEKERKELDEFAKKNKISNLNVNLSHARMAIQYVQSKIRFASNHDMLDPKSWDYRYIATGRQDEDDSYDWKKDACVNKAVRANPTWQSAVQSYDPANLAKIRDLAINPVRMTGSDGVTRDLPTNCGNCVEQAAIAFTFLHRLGVKPLDYCALTPYTRRIDHVFVVIGRTRDADPKNTKVDPWAQWNDDAVICDPWTPGLLQAPGKDGAPGKAFGESFGAYQAKFLRQNLSKAFPGFTGINMEYPKKAS